MPEALSRLWRGTFPPPKNGFVSSGKPNASLTRRKFRSFGQSSSTTDNDSSKAGRTFEQAAAKFVRENQHKRSLHDDVGRLKGLMPFIGHIPLEKVHMGTMQPWITHRRKEGVAIGTINHGLQIVRRILNLASGEWVDEQGQTWVATTPRIRLLPDLHKREPYPLTWDEQLRLLRELPSHLRDMALFAVNTGCRDAEICSLSWKWEVEVPELGLSVFTIPGERVKNGKERLVILNRIATSVIASRRGHHASHVFAYKGNPMRCMMGSGWRTARLKVGLPNVRVHDLKHTFGRRLRAAGVSFEDRQDLLGHRSGRITTHYSAAELTRLIEAAETVVETEGKRPELVVLRGRQAIGSRKTPAPLGEPEVRS